MVKTTWISPLPNDAAGGTARKNSQLVGVTLDDWDKNAKLEAFNWGITNFDTFFSACLVVFQSITLKGGVDIMYMTTDASCSFYFYLLAVVFIKAFILMNVTLTVAFKELKEKLATQVSRTLPCQLRVRRFEHALQRCLRRGICDPTPRLRPETLTCVSIPLLPSMLDEVTPASVMRRGGHFARTMVQRRSAMHVDASYSCGKSSKGKP